MNADTIYIILPVHNRCQVTRRFLACLTSQTHQNYHVVLVDDGSTDGTSEMAQSTIQSLTVIKGEGKWWWAGSLQQGYKWLKKHTVSLSDIVLIMNDDTEFDEKFLDTGIALLRQQSHTLLSPWLYSAETGELLNSGLIVDWKRLRFESTTATEKVNCMSTRSMFMTIGDLFLARGFRPWLLPHYLSDYEFAIRARRKGMKLCYDGRLKVLVHEQEPDRSHDRHIAPSDDRARMFSKKSPRNPLYWTIFIALSCPWKWKALNWLRVWKGFFFATDKPARQ